MKDLTAGKPLKIILTFTLSIFLGTIISLVHNITDTVIVGNFINADAFTGVGLTGSIIYFISGFASGITAGFSVKIAQAFGAKDYSGMRQAIAMALYLTAIVSAILVAVFAPLSGTILRLMDTPEQNFGYAYYYLLITCCGIPVTMLGGLIIGALRATGDARFPVVLTLISVVANVAFDFLFILVFKMHYTGAALASKAASLISIAVGFVYMRIHCPLLNLKLKDFKWRGEYIKQHLAIGLPMALQTSITGIGMMVQQAALNGLSGTVHGAVTAYVAATKIDNIITSLFGALGTAVATYAGQNSGAGRFDRVRQGVRAGLLLSVIFTAFGIAFNIGLGKPIMRLFVNPDKGGDAALYFDEILSLGLKYLIFQCSFYWLLGIVNVLRNTLQGEGKSFIAMFAGLCEAAGRIIASLGFVKIWGFTGICVSNPAAWLFADVFFISVYFTVLHIQKKRTAKPSDATAHETEPQPEACVTQTEENK